MQDLINYFISKPKQLSRSAGKFVRGERGGDLFKGTTIDQVNEAKRLAREYLNKQREEINTGMAFIPIDKFKQPYYTTTTSYSKNVNEQEGTVKSEVVIDFEPKTVEELYELHKIDKDQYVIKNYWTKQAQSGKFTSSVFCTKRTLDDITGNDILTTLKNYRPSWGLKAVAPKINTVFTRPTCLLIDITDFHLDKRDIYGTTLEEKVEQYKTTLNEITLKACHSNKIEEIIFIIGSDFLHTDTYFGTTTRGTQQDINTNWKNAFDVAFQLYADSIVYLQNFCERLKVVNISGNHSYTKEYYLAFALEKALIGLPNTTFDISPAYRKAFTYGKQFLGFHHGNCKQEQLPLIFAKEFSEQWGKASNHMVITGDKHHSFERDINGVILKQFPAMTNADAWHDASNYHLAEKASIALIFDKEKGRIMEIHSK